MEYALNTETRMNPSNPSAATYYDERVCIYVIDVTRDPARPSLRVYTSYGSATHAVGDRLDMRSSLQPNRSLCGYRGATVVAVIDTDGTTTGTLPTRGLPHWVAK
jgi:hypothetical protein